MRLLFGLFAAALALSACDAPQPQVAAAVDFGGQGQTGQVGGSSHIQFLGGDGSAVDQAILIYGARGEADGVKSEYDWLATHRPGWRAVGQALLTKGNRQYDVLHTVGGGQSVDVYFDISEYFGKF